MMPFMTQPAVAPACYVPRAGVAAQSQMLKGAQYLIRTPNSPGNRRVWTFAGWVSPQAFGSVMSLLMHRVVPVTSLDRQTLLQLDAGGSLSFSCQDNGTYDGHLITSALYRDSAWLHVHVAFETPLDAESERVRMTINGRRITEFSTKTNVPQNYEGANNSTVPHRIGVYHASMGNLQFFLSALLSDLFMVDGLALPETVFGEFNIHGVWVPKPKDEIHSAIAAKGGFGVNGFHLDFSDPLNPGKDVSGKGNHFTAVGFDATGKDTVASTPSNVYATLNALNYGSSGMTLSGGGLTATASDGSGAGSTILLASGKWYFETRLTAGSNGFNCVGLFDASSAPAMELISAANCGWFISADGTLYDHDTVTAGYGAKASAGDRIMCALDLDAGKIWWGRNGGWYGGGDPAVGTAPAAANLGGAVYPGVVLENGCVQDINFGQRPWAYVPPVGFKAICTDNLPEPDIKDPSEALAQVATTGVNMVPVLDAATAHWSSGGWVEIIKRLDADESWRWRFSDDPAQSVASDTQAAKGAAATLVSGANYVGLRLRIGQRYGVYTAEVNHVTGIATTVAHGLATPRNMVLVKRADAASDWLQWHPDLPAGNLLTFNSNVAAAPNSGITGIGGNSFQIGAAMPSGTYRVLVLAERPGFIALGKYSGGATYPFAASDVAPLLFCQKRISGVGEHRIWLDATASGNPKPCLDVNNAGVLDGTYSADLDCGGARPNTAVIEIGAAGESYVHLQIGRPIGGVCVAPATAR